MNICWRFHVAYSMRELKRCCDHFKRETFETETFIHQRYWNTYVDGGRTGFSLGSGEWGVGRGIIKPLPNGAEFVWISVTCKLQDCRVAQKQWCPESDHLCRSLQFSTEVHMFFHTSSRVADTQMPLFYFIFFFTLKVGNHPHVGDQVKVKG